MLTYFLHALCYCQQLFLGFSKNLTETSKRKCFPVILDFHIFMFSFIPVLMHDNFLHVMNCKLASWLACCLRSGAPHNHIRSAAKKTKCQTNVIVSATKWKQFSILSVIAYMQCNPTKITTGILTEFSRFYKE